MPQALVQSRKIASVTAVGVVKYSSRVQWARQDSGPRCTAPAAPMVAAPLGHSNYKIDIVAYNLKAFTVNMQFLWNCQSMGTHDHYLSYTFIDQQIV